MLLQSLLGRHHPLAISPAVESLMGEGETTDLAKACAEFLELIVYGYILPTFSYSSLGFMGLPYSANSKAMSNPTNKLSGETHVRYRKVLCSTHMQCEHMYRAQPFVIQGWDTGLHTGM